MTMLSVDFDFFVPEDPMDDMGHLESPFYDDSAWKIRAVTSLSRGDDMIKRIRTNGKERSFWKDISSIFQITKSTMIYIAESHKDAYDVARLFDVTQVFNFDSHCDLGYYGLERLRKENVSCENWLGKLGFSRNIAITQVYSDHTLEKDSSQFDEILSKRSIYSNFYGDFLKQVQMDKENRIPVPVIYICRSGSWVPPWLDKDFFKFIESLGLHCNYLSRLKKRSWDSSEIRREAKGLAKVMEYVNKNF